MESFQIIGVLNVTPDSFHDGGWYKTVDDAVSKAGEMLASGADWIEVGGESTGPDSKEISLEEELRRVIPVVARLRRGFPSAKIAVDTYKSAVARKAIEEGARMINDVTGGRRDLEMFSTIASTDAMIVLMHAKDSTPRTTIGPVQYDDVVLTIKNFLVKRRDAAVAAGIPGSRIILDPGLGHFVSSDPKYSFEIIARLREFENLGCPLLLSPSRKSFLAGPENLKTTDRLPGTIAASALAVFHGANFIRTHDVQEVKRGCEAASFTGKGNSQSSTRRG